MSKINKVFRKLKIWVLVTYLKESSNFVQIPRCRSSLLGSPNPDHVTYSSYQSMVIVSSPTGSGHRLQGVLQHELYPSQDQPFLAGFADSQQGWRSCLYITCQASWASGHSCSVLPTLEICDFWFWKGVDLDYRSHHPCHPLHTGPGELKNENVHASSAKMMSLKGSHGGLA